MPKINSTREPVVSEKANIRPTYTKGIPKDLVVKIQHTFLIHDFVETGTYEGTTATWAAGIFPRVITVEASSHYYERLKPLNSQYTNVEFVFGHSGVELDRIVESLGTPAVFWLDGHWSCEETYGENDECPVLKEIESINRSPHEHFVFIDDARLFMSPPPKPHLPNQWPTVVQVLDALRSRGRKPYIVVFSDVIIACPEWAEPLVSEWCQTAATQLWEAELQSVAKSRGDQQLFQLGMRLIAKAVRSLNVKPFISHNRANR